MKVYIFLVSVHMCVYAKAAEEVEGSTSFTSPCDVIFPLLAYFLHSPHESSSCIHTDDGNDSCVITLPITNPLGWLTNHRKLEGVQQ